MPLNDEFLRALGRVTANFSALEHHVSAVVAGTIGANQKIGQAVAANFSFTRSLDYLSAVCKLNADEGEDFESVGDLLPHLAELEQRRNQIIHSAWMTPLLDPADRTVVRFKMSTRRKSGLSHMSEETTKDDLENLADEIRETAEKLAELAFSLAEKGLLNIQVFEGPIASD